MYRLEDYIQALKVEATKLQPLKGVSPNLSTHQKEALGKLSENKNLVIKKADKGSTMVVLDKQDYVEKGFKHLSDHVRN